MYVYIYDLNNYLNNYSYTYTCFAAFILCYFINTRTKLLNVNENTGNAGGVSYTKQYLSFILSERSKLGLHLEKCFIS